MRLSYGIMALSALAFGAQLTVAQAQNDPVSGSRPGNDVGTRSSLPLSPYASNMSSTDTKSTIAPTPPEPNVGPDASVQQLLMAGKQSLAAGQTGTTEEALEQAETQLLSRPVLASRTDDTSQNPVVAMITQARTALGAGDKAGTMRIIDQILASGAPELTD